MTLPGTWAFTYPENTMNDNAKISPSRRRPTRKLTGEPITQGPISRRRDIETEDVLPPEWKPGDGDGTASYWEASGRAGRMRHGERVDSIEHLRDLSGDAWEPTPAGVPAASWRALYEQFSREVIDSTFEWLGPRHREAWTLVVHDGTSQTAAARTMGISQPRVSVLLKEAERFIGGRIPDFSTRGKRRRFARKLADQFAGGATADEIAAEYGCSPQTALELAVAEGDDGEGL